MIIKEDTLNRIRRIIDSGYNRLSLAILGTDSGSLLESIYYHNFLNEQGKSGAPNNLEGMKSQQTPENLPKGEAHTAAIQILNTSMAQLLKKHKAEVEARVVGIIQSSNNNYRNDALKNLRRPDSLDSLAKQRMLPDLKKKIENYMTKEAESDWTRIAVTELSNAIGAGSIDAVVARNRESDPQEVYVFRIPVNDANLCKYCRRFYLDSDGSPKVYRLSTLLSNGTNYGKKAEAWLPVAGATHPNERCSQIIELRPGWKVNPGGTVSYLGMDKWNSYIFQKVSS